MIFKNGKIYKNATERVIEAYLEIRKNELIKSLGIWDNGHFEREGPIETVGGPIARTRKLNTNAETIK